MVDWSKVFVAPRCWSAAIASSASARMLSSNLAQRDVRHAILQPGTKWLAGRGSGRRVWQRVMRDSSVVINGPRRTYLRSTSPIFLGSVGERELHKAVAVVLEKRRSSGDRMGMSTAKDLCAQPGDEAMMAERVVGLARREGPRTFALAAREEGESGP